MGRYDEERKKLGIAVTNYKAESDKFDYTSKYAEERRKLFASESEKNLNRFMDIQDRILNPYKYTESAQQLPGIMI